MSSVESLAESDRAAVQSGPGAMLRAARESQGLPIALLAMSLKVPVKKLEALEADRYDLLPDTVFVRALASSVCRALKVDAIPVLAALPHAHFRKIKTDESGLNATFNDSASSVGISTLFQIKKPLGVTVLALLAGIIAIVFWPATPLNDPVSVALTSVAVDMQTEAAASLQPPASVSPLMLSDSMNGRMQTKAVSPAQIAGSSPSLRVESVSSGLVAVANADAVLTLHAHGESWVEVVDAQGASRLRRTVMRDEILPVSGVLPLAVVLGRADAVSVAIRGQAFDTAPLSKNNVARFEVK